MTSAVIETAAGRAMLINALMRGELDSPLSLVKLGALVTERLPHHVHYRRGRYYYCPPDTFGFVLRHGPTDCDWIVPGTAG